MQTTRNNLDNQLFQIKEISGRYLSTDSVLVSVDVRENNLKTSMENQFDKNKTLKRSRGCSLQSAPAKKSKNKGQFLGIQSSKKY